MPSISISSRDAGYLWGEIEQLVDAALNDRDIDNLFEEEEIKSYVRDAGPLAFWTREELLDILDINHIE